MKAVKHLLIVIMLNIPFYSMATIIINVPVCNIDQQCGIDAKCQNNCLFQGLNAAGDIFTIKADRNVIIKDLDYITKNTITNVLFEKKSKQVIINYIPTMGRLQNKSVTILFQLVDLSDNAYIAKLPKIIRTGIAKYVTNNSSIGYALFIAKELRKNIWMEISQTYIDRLSKDEAKIPVIVQPDGNIYITTPAEKDKREEVFYIKIEQI